MRCIFCKSQSESSRSVEHIIPESLGNLDHTLPGGVVCDSCNNYFARKVEKPVLDSPMMRLLRSDRQIPNKRRRFPTFEPCEPPNLPDYRLMSRFLTKAALEALAFKTLSVPESNMEIVDKVELDDLRAYARYDRGETWPFAYRTLYPVNAAFKEGSTHYELLHEFDVFYTDATELYFALAILGVEFVVNLGGPELDGYQQWLKTHDYASPLYRSAAT
ncbi:MAG: hypothetical protein QOD99_1393 [Chthoniobacter sp.]|nr:hypothetical protein [Chthoniobacter sp.]